MTLFFFRYCINKNFCLGTALHSMHMSIKEDCYTVDPLKYELQNPFQ